jgi:3-dehydroquinate dehydratase II
MKKIGIINGPNLNLVGTREPAIYGTQTFEQLLDKLRQDFPDIEFHYYQSNVEGEMVTAIQQLGMSCQGLIVNAGAYSHTSIAIGDAVAGVSVPVVEVHISNIYAREEFRKYSHVSAKARGMIVGLGIQGYVLAVNYLQQA